MFVFLMIRGSPRSTRADTLFPYTTLFRSVLATSLAQKHGTRLHVLHISTADELALFEPGPLVRADGSRKRITAETCVHFLRFDRADYARLGHLIKCNPAIKDAGDREALVADRKSTRLNPSHYCAPLMPSSA